MCGNAGVNQTFGGYTPGPNAEERQAMIDAPRLAAEAAQTKAVQSANAKLAKDSAANIASGRMDGRITGHTPRTPHRSRR